MIAPLEVCMTKHHDAAVALMEHFGSKDDDKGLELFDEVLEYSFMSLRVMADAFRAREGKHGT